MSGTVGVVLAPYSLPRSRRRTVRPKSACVLKVFGCKPIGLVENLHPVRGQICQAPLLHVQLYMQLPPHTGSEHMCISYKSHGCESIVQSRAMQQHMMLRCRLHSLSALYIPTQCSVPLATFPMAGVAAAPLTYPKWPVDEAALHTAAELWPNRRRSSKGQCSHQLTTIFVAQTLLQPMLCLITKVI